jgi:uncharacterized membrane protein YgdD (TMEM256/DUF423 family)
VNKTWLIWASFFGGLAVVAGAMMAHVLKSRMTSDAWAIFDTAVKYQFYHAFALLATGIVAGKIHSIWISRAGILFTMGIWLFSGSLYFISALLTTGSPVPVLLGICTPLGGISLILGWIFLGVGIWKGENS